MKGPDAAISLDSLKIPDFGWQKSIDDLRMKQWEKPEWAAVLSLNFFDVEPDLVSILDINALRYSLRDSVQPLKGGLVEVEVLDVKGFDAVRLIFKVPRKPFGMDYLGSLIIPFESYSYVVKVQAEEVGMTGLRDSVVAAKWSVKNKGRASLSKGPDGFLRDPYHPELTEGTLMNVSDEECYDSDFPDHPLTRVRNGLNQVASEIDFRPELQRIARFHR